MYAKTTLLDCFNSMGEYSLYFWNIFKTDINNNYSKIRVNELKFMVKILIKKFDKNIKLPVYKTYGSSGMDIVAHTKNKITIKINR